MYRLIWVFTGHTGLIVGFVVHWLLQYFVEDNFILREMDTLKGGNIVKIIFASFLNRVLLLKKRIWSPSFAPKGSKFFHFWLESFSEGTWAQLFETNDVVS